MKEDYLSYNQPLKIPSILKVQVFIKPSFCPGVMNVHIGPQYFDPNVLHLASIYGS